MAEELPNLGKLIKLMKMTTSPVEAEALSAIRMANKELVKFGGDWEALLSGKVTVIGDPFVGVSAAAPKRNAPPPRPPVRQPASSKFTPNPPRPQPTPQSPPWGASQATSKPAFDPFAAQPAQPSPAAPQMSFTKTDTGHFRVKSNRPLRVGDTYEIPTRNGSLRRVEITSVVGQNPWGDYLYQFINAPHNVGNFL